MQNLKEMDQELLKVAINKLNQVEKNEPQNKMEIEQDY